ncbi:MAG: histidinol phosphate phosphatase [Alphaproteobacteria bacterium]|nr:histidinol phosphate phosphatase [Alphaproteobacteria bacterium]
MNEFTALANRLADEAGEIIRTYFRAGFDVESKADHSPVTIADRAVEERLRAIIERERPEDGIYGEEFGIKDSQSGLTWVLDPIDGTKSFVIGRPTFGTLIALCEEDVPVLGVIDQAVLGERWIGVKGEQTTFNDQPVKTRSCQSLGQACAASTTPAMFEGLKAAGGAPVYEQFETAFKMMAWGGDCYMYGLLASGFMDIAVEANLSPYDFAALVPVVEGAGGHMRDWEGQPLTLASDGKTAAVGDGTLLDEILGILS